MPVPSDTNPEAVEWYVSNASEILSEEHRRGESLQTRAGQLAGFGGVSLALLGSLVPRAFADLSSREEWVAGGTYVTALALFAVTIVIAVIWILRPVSYHAIDASEVDEYLTDDFLRAERWEVQVRTLRALALAVGTAQTRNQEKARWLVRAVFVYLVGLVVTGVCVATLAINAISV